MSNVYRLRPRPPTTTVALNALELRLIVTALDNAEHTLRMNAPAESAAQYGVSMLRARLQIALAHLEREGSPA